MKDFDDTNMHGTTIKNTVLHSCGKSETYASQNYQLPERGSNRLCVQNLTSVLPTHASGSRTLIQCLHTGLHNPSVWFAVKVLRCKLALKYQHNSFVYVFCMDFKCVMDIAGRLEYIS
jgi:hypothetical protein